MYERDIDYLEAEKDLHLNARPDRKLQIVLSNLLKEQKDTRNRLEELNKLPNPSSAEQAEFDSIIAAQYPSCVQRFLLTEYQRANTSRWGLILICGLFYVVGTAIMLWLLIHKSIKVFEA
jgi:hypothetical protein